MGWQSCQEFQALRLPSGRLAIHSALPILVPDVLDHLGPGLLPSVTAGHRPQRHHWIDVGPGPMHPGPFQPSLHDQFVGTLDAATANRIALGMTPRIIEPLPPLLHIAQTRVNGGDGPDRLCLHSVGHTKSCIMSPRQAQNA